MAELRHDEVAAVVRRATEIEALNRQLSATDAEIAEFIRAAEEAVISRDATLQALRERLHFKPEAYKPGQIVFAESGDGRMYPARVLEVGDADVSIRFASGSEAKVGFAKLRPFTLCPGEKIEYNSPSFFTWVTGEIVRVHLDGGSVTASYACIEETLPLERIRMAQPKPEIPFRDKAFVWGVGVVTGAVGICLGTMLGWVIFR